MVGFAVVTGTVSYCAAKRQSVKDALYVCMCTCGGCRAGRMLCVNVLSDATTAAAL